MEEKIRVKELGPDKPDLIINQQTKEKNKVYNRSFCRSWFERKSWLTGCGIANALFCFPCILFKSEKCDSTWTQSGQTDLKHLFERIKKHERSKVHMENSIKLAVLGNISIAAQLDEGHRVVHVTGPDLAWYWIRSGPHLGQITIKEFASGPVLVQMRKNGSMPVLARCAKGHRPKSDLAKNFRWVWAR
ncbi:zinc finger MYM-type 1-like protein [Labeo rohita]|uniref:Zinc finger MYM-type 1-like protein n=1 Tax=Labeo rohita TaxID=84645 RepID=A0A498P887_LABRO|nr:zinc finger MYM-type 1-like protein [Labeo rohita]